MVQTHCVKPKLLVIAGPTAVGKSQFAVQCALKYDGVVIGADSMQIYRGFDIGTGKVTEAEKQGVKHVMIDIVAPDANYSVAEYAESAKKEIDECTRQGKLPILTGGTGFYINAVLNGFNFADADKDEAVRQKFEQIAELEGSERLHEMLRQVDALSAQKISPFDKKRLVRALEIFEVTGKAKSQRVATAECPYHALTIVLDDERERLYQNIHSRVQKMFEKGLLQEVESLLQYKDCQSMQAIGYKEVVKYFENQWTLDQAKEKVILNSRHYAKRQLTYFRHFHAEKHFFHKNQLLQAEDLIKTWREQVLCDA